MYQVGQGAKFRSSWAAAVSNAGSSSAFSAGQATAAGAAGAAQGAPNASNTRPAWVTVAHRLLKKGWTASRERIKLAVETCDNNVDRAVRYIIDNKLASKAALATAAHSKRERPSDNTSAFKKGRTNANITNEEAEKLIARLKPNVQEAVRAAITNQPVATIASLLIPGGSQGAGGAITEFQEQIPEFLTIVASALNDIPEAREKVACIIPAFEMLAEMHSVDTELNEQLQTMQTAVTTLVARPTSVGTPDAFAQSFSQYSTTLNTLMNFFNLVSTKFKHLRLRSKQTAEKFRGQLKMTIMKQKKVVKQLQRYLNGTRQKIIKLDSDIMSDLDSGTSSRSAPFAVGDSVLAKIPIPNLSTDAFLPSTVREVDTEKSRVRVEYGSDPAAPSSAWVRYEDVQSRRNETDEMRLRSNVFAVVQNPAKARLLQQRQTAYGQVTEYESKLSVAEAKWRIHDESRKLADAVMMQDENKSAQPFELDASQLTALLGQLRGLTATIGKQLDAVARLQIERRENSLKQVQAEQSKLETHQRLYPTMQRQMEQLQLNVRDWQDMAKRCSDDDLKLLNTVSVVVSTVSSAPQWLVQQAFSAGYQAEVRGLPRTLRARVLNDEVRSSIERFMVGLAESKLWAMGGVADYVRTTVAPQLSGGSTAETQKLRDVVAQLRSADLAINGRISIWWAEDKRAYGGVLVKPTTFASTGLLQVNYDDGDVRQYPVERVVARATRALPPRDFLNHELKRRNVPATIGDAVNLFSWKDMRIWQGLLQVPASFTAATRLNPIVAVAGSNGTVERALPVLASEIKTAARVTEYNKRLKETSSVQIGGKCTLRGEGGTSCTGTITLLRKPMETEGKLSVVLDGGAQRITNHYSIGELVARITQAAIDKRAGQHATALFPPTGNSSSISSLLFPSATGATAASGSNSSIFSTSATAQPHSSGVLVAQLRAAGITAPVGTPIRVWRGATDDQNPTVEGVLSASKSGSGVDILDKATRAVLLTCSVPRLKELLVLAAQFDGAARKFDSDNLRGVIALGRTLHVWSSSHNRVCTGSLSAKRFEELKGKFEIRFMDGTTEVCSAAELVSNVSRAAAVLVDRLLAAKGVTSVSAVAGSATTVWLGASRGPATGTLRAGFSKEGVPRVMVVQKDGSTDVAVLNCTVDELSRRVEQAKQFEEGQAALQKRGLRIGGPIHVWWTGDNRAYRGTLQLEENFDKVGKLTVRYDDGDVKHYNVPFLMARVDDARENGQGGDDVPTPAATSAPIAVPSDSDGSGSSGDESPASTSSSTAAASSSPRAKFRSVAESAMREMQSRQRIAADAETATPSPGQQDNADTAKSDGNCVVM